MNYVRGKDFSVTETIRTLMKYAERALRVVPAPLIPSLLLQMQLLRFVSSNSLCLPDNDLKEESPSSHPFQSMPLHAAV